VQLAENPPENPAELAGWVSLERKPFCSDCVASFTEEDWDWLAKAPVPLGLAQLASLIPGDVEPF
jgi:hypothetical protein